ncbi:myelin protein zero-like protein 1 isoform X4 [Microcaecilia unicolor]|uniref:Myelin protein P0 n=1 Tax=Microcaecilia unicolor TaxID=1415580 RepID=A0A6P7Y9N8_9AMPH|nr:myelin protein zero-like protein 1 isoform X4 [Microcaecilia unicolor]
MWRVGLVRLCAFSWALKLAFVFTVKAIEVYTPKELIVENGTQAKLPCTFKTSEVVSSSTAVTWIFKPEGGGRSFTFFYYTSGRHFMDVAPFKDRVSWAGDLNKKDASIYIKNMQFQDNGTYFCDLKNPPDIDATVTGEIQLKVVEKDGRSQEKRMPYKSSSSCKLSRCLASKRYIRRRRAKTRLMRKAPSHQHQTFPIFFVAILLHPPIHLSTCSAPCTTNTTTFHHSQSPPCRQE